MTTTKTKTAGQTEAPAAASDRAQATAPAPIDVKAFYAELATATRGIAAKIAAFKQQSASALSAEDAGNLSGYQSGFTRIANDLLK
jgi:hypothetical protein